MKLYAQELHSDWMREQVNQASYCIVSQMALVEICAALSLKEKTGLIHTVAVKTVLARLRTEWSMFQQFGIDQSLIQNASELALRFGLRAYDSVQLASAQKAHWHLGNTMFFCCFDKPLNRAAQSLEIPILTI
ncbi:MAG: hypothetical protein RIR79_2382 [Pseudomonadota bacterium]